MKQAIASLTLTIFFFIGSFAFLSAANHFAHNDGCPFMFDPGAHCMMSPIEHLVSIQNSLTATIASLFALLTVVLPVFSFIFKPKKLQNIPASFQKKLVPESPPLYQLLLSQGILHPKAP